MEITHVRLVDPEPGRLRLEIRTATVQDLSCQVPLMPIDIREQYLRHNPPSHVIDHYAAHPLGLIFGLYKEPKDLLKDVDFQVVYNTIEENKRKVLYEGKNVQNLTGGRKRSNFLRSPSYRGVSDNEIRGYDYLS